MILEFSLSEPPMTWLFMRRESNDARLSWRLGPGRWQLFLFVLYGTLRTGARAYSIKPGSVVIIPPRSRSVLDIDAPGEPEAYHTHYHVNFTPVDSATDVFAFEQHTDLEEKFPFWNEQFLQALDFLEYTPAPRAPLLWQLLWSLAINPIKVEKNPYLVRAQQRIREQLATPFRVADLAEELRISQNHLTNLFRAQLGSTPRQYIREARAEEALRLLTSSTLPIKQIASRVAMSNLHQFNRFVRETLGASPRAIRSDRQLMMPFASRKFE